MKRSALYIFIFSLPFLIFLFVPYFFDHVFAQATGKSNCVITKIGNPQQPPVLPPGCSAAGGNTPISTFANDLAAAAIANCPNGQITSGNYGCMANKIPASANYPEKAYAQIQVSASSFSYFQCVGFVDAVSAGVYGNTPQPQGNAINWWYNNHTVLDETTGQTVTYIQNPKTQPAEGDFPVWAVDSFGHIGVVIKVYDPDHIEVAEANWVCDGCVRNTRNIQVSASSILGFLHKQ